MFTSTPTALTQSSTTASSVRARPCWSTSCWYWPDADRLRLDLDQLGQRVLQPPRDRDRAAQRSRRDPGTPPPPAPRPSRPRRPPPRPSPWSSFSSGHAAPSARPPSLSVSRLAVPLPMAISSTPCCCDKRRERRQRPVPVASAARADRSCRCRSTLPVPSTTATLTPVRMPGSSPIVGARPGRRGQQQVLEVLREHARSPRPRPRSLQSRQQVAGQRSGQLAAPGQRARSRAARRRPAARGRRRRRPSAMRRSGRCGSASSSSARRGRGRERPPSRRAASPATRCEGMSLHGSREVEVVGELGALGLLALATTGGEHRPRVHSHSRSPPTQLGVLGDALDQDVARAVERRLASATPFSASRNLAGLRFGSSGGFGEQRVGQRLEPGLARDLRLGAPLRLERQVDVLQLDLGLGAARSLRAARASACPARRCDFRTVARRSSSSRR